MSAAVPRSFVGFVQVVFLANVRHPPSKPILDVRFVHGSPDHKTYFSKNSKGLKGYAHRRRNPARDAKYTRLRRRLSRGSGFLRW